MRWGVILLLAAVAASAQVKLNFYEGETTVDGQPVTVNSNQPVAAGSTVSALDGRLEIRLAPDVYLRLGNHSSARIIEETPAEIRAELLSGSAIIDSVRAGSGAPVVQLTLRDATIRIRTPGEYEFIFSSGQLRFTRGEAQVVRNGQSVAVKAPQAAYALTAATGQPAAADAADNDTLLNIWSANRRIALSSLLSGSAQPQQPLAGKDNDVAPQSTAALGLLSLGGLFEPLYVPMRPYRPGSQFFGSGFGYWYPYFTYPPSFRQPGAQPYRPIHPLPPGLSLRPGVPGFVGGPHIPGPVIGH